MLPPTLFQTFANLIDRPITVDLTIEEGQRLKVVYGSKRGFHGIDLDTSKVFDIYIPHVSIAACLSADCKEVASL